MDPPMKDSVGAQHVPHHEHKDLEEPDDSSVGIKRLLVTEQLDYGDLTTDLTGDPKKRKLSVDQQHKRQKYDVLHAFFRVFLVEDKDGLVEKDAIFNLYVRKVPAEHLIARNALYRRMWSFFKDKNISTYQQHYRENVKGLRLRRGLAEPLPQDLEKEVDLLRMSGVKEPVLDFNEHELVDIPPATPPMVIAKTSAAAAATTLSALDKIGVTKYLTDGSNPNFIGLAIDALESQAKLLVQALAELKAKVNGTKPDN